MEKILKENGLKITKARLLILEALSKEKFPVEIDHIFKKIKKSGIDLATLYRTITTLEDKGVVKKIKLKNDASSFELNSKHHHHIVCTKCETFEDFESGEVENILQKIGRGSKKFKNITDHSLELFGLCRMCK